MPKKLTKPELRRLKQTAYHEAGHAVAAYVMHRRFTSVSIIPEEDDDSYGRCSMGKWLSNLNPEWDTGNKVRNLVEREAMIYMAGAQAVARLTGRINWVGFGYDKVKAINIINRLCDDEKELGAYFRWLWERTRIWVKFSLHWAMIEALSEALMEQPIIGERKARAVIAAARQARLERAIEDNESLPGVGRFY